MHRGYASPRKSGNRGWNKVQPCGAGCQVCNLCVAGQGSAGCAGTNPCHAPRVPLCSLAPRAEVGQKIAPRVGCTQAASLESPQGPAAPRLLSFQQHPGWCKWATALVLTEQEGKPAPALHGLPQEPCERDALHLRLPAVSQPRVQPQWNPACTKGRCGASCNTPQLHGHFRHKKKNNVTCSHLGTLAKSKARMSPASRMLQLGDMEHTACSQCCSPAPHLCLPRAAPTQVPSPAPHLSLAGSETHSSPTIQAGGGRRKATGGSWAPCWTQNTANRPAHCSCHAAAPTRIPRLPSPLHLPPPHRISLLLMCVKIRK